MKKRPHLNILCKFCKRPGWSRPTPLSFIWGAVAEKCSPPTPSQLPGRSWLAVRSECKKVAGVGSGVSLGLGSHLECVDPIIHGPLKVIQQLLCGSSQHHCADLALLLGLLQNDDRAAADVLAAETLGVADLVCSRCSQLHLGCRACRSAHQQRVTANMPWLMGLRFRLRL